MKRRPTDEKLSAYVLNELDDVERQEMNAAVEGDEKIADEVDQLRLTARLTQSALQAQHTKVLSEGNRRTILDRAEQIHLHDALPRVPSSLSARSSWLLGASAAGLVLLFGAGFWVSAPTGQVPKDQQDSPPIESAYEQHQEVESGQAESRIKLVDMAPKPDGTWRVQIQTAAGDKKWMEEGETFYEVVLLSLDPETHSALIYEEDTDKTYDVCNPECC